MRGIPFCSWQFSTKIVNQENISHLIEVSENVYLNVVFNSQNMGSSLFLDYLWDVVSFLKKTKNAAPASPCKFLLCFNCCFRDQYPLFTKIISLSQTVLNRLQIFAFSQIIGLYPYLVQFTETSSPQISSSVKDALMEYHDLLQPYHSQQ